MIKTFARNFKWQPPLPNKTPKNKKTACRLIWSILADGNEGRSAARFFVICITIRRTWVCLWMTAAAPLSLFGCQSGSPQAGWGWDNKHAPCSCWVSSVYLKFSSHFRSINTSVNIQLFPRTLKLFVFPCMKTACPAYCNHGGEMLWNYRAVYLPFFFFRFFSTHGPCFQRRRWQPSVYTGRVFDRDCDDVSCKQQIVHQSKGGWGVIRWCECRKAHSESEETRFFFSFHCRSCGYFL